MKMMKRVITVASLIALAACGGGGGDAGTSSFSSGSGATSGTTGGTSGGTTGGTSGGTTGGSTSSGGISTVSTGVPSQRFMSISAEKYNLNWGLDGDTTKIQVFVADTAGNPIADGTTIQFSTEGGQIETSCKTTGFKSGASTISGCSVTFNTQDFRPHDGMVTVIAWLDGEEAYKDLNADGKYTAGEPFLDSGLIFRDDDRSGTYDPTKDELSIGATLAGAPGIGTQACIGDEALVNINEAPKSVDNTCDGVWGRTLIRRTITLPVSDPRALAIEPQVGFGVWVGTSLILPGETTPIPLSNQSAPRAPAAPAGTTVTVLNPPAGCTVTVSPATVGIAEVTATLHKIVVTTADLTSGDPCFGKSVTVEAKFGNYSPVSTSFTLPHISAP
jgi:hypothetical protein